VNSTESNVEFVFEVPNNVTIGKSIIYQFFKYLVMNFFLFLDTNELCVDEFDESYGSYNISWLFLIL